MAMTAVEVQYTITVIYIYCTVDGDEWQVRVYQCVSCLAGV